MKDKNASDLSNTIFGLLVIVGLAMAGNDFFQRFIEIVTGGATSWLF